MPKIWNKYSQKRNIGVSVPISTFMCLWANYIFPQWVCLFCWRKYVDVSCEYINRSQTYECGNWGWGRAIPRKGIYIWGIAVAVYPTDDILYNVVKSKCLITYISYFCADSLAWPDGSPRSEADDIVGWAGGRGGVHLHRHRRQGQRTGQGPALRQVPVAGVFDEPFSQLTPLSRAVVQARQST